MDIKTLATPSKKTPRSVTAAKAEPLAQATNTTPTNNLQSIQRQHSLASQVRRAIEQMIENGNLSPGDWINEALIASQLNVSRGTVREGCRSLQESGLVHIIINRGAFVRQIESEEAAELYDLRAVLFGLAGRTLAQKVTKQQITLLNRSVAKMDKLAAADDVAGYYEENGHFHNMLLEFAGNKRLAEQYHAYARELQLFLRKALAQRGRLIGSNDEHRKIVQLIANRDPEGTAAFMEWAVLEGKKRILGAT